MGAGDRRIRSSKTSLGYLGSLRSAWDTADHFKVKNKNPVIGRMLCYLSHLSTREEAKARRALAKIAVIVV